MTNTDAIRTLNDDFRTRLVGGRLMLTRGIVGRADVEEILQRVKSFDDFSADNDPHHEHDFGAFEQGGETIFWKIDYYSPDLQNGSSDPADAKNTLRVMTVMLAAEY